MSEVQKHEGGSIKHDIAVPVARVPEFVARANQLVELDDPRRAARAVRPSRRRQHPLQCQPAARHGPRHLPELLGGAERRRARDRARSRRLDQRRARDRALEARSPAPRQRAARARADAEDQGSVRSRTSFSIPGSCCDEASRDRQGMDGGRRLHHRLLRARRPRPRCCARGKRSGRAALRSMSRPIRASCSCCSRARSARAASWRSARSAATARSGSRAGFPLAGGSSRSRPIPLMPKSLAPISRAPGFGAMVEVRVGKAHRHSARPRRRSSLRPHLHRCRQGRHARLFPMGGQALAPRLADHRGQCRARGRGARC